MKKQTVDSISKQNLVDDIMTDSTIPNCERYDYEEYELQQIARDFLDKEREQSDKLWLYLSYGLGLFIVGYMAYHFIRFLIM